MVNLADQPVLTCSQRDQYDPLYHHLVSATEDCLRIPFTELEAILGFPLPPAARLQRQWWSNERHGQHRTHVLAWNAAGWTVEDVSLESETLVFVRCPDFPRITPTIRTKKKEKMLDIRKNWAPVSIGPWPPGFTVSREQIYGDFGCLTGGAQDKSEPHY